LGAASAGRGRWIMSDVRGSHGIFRSRRRIVVSDVGGSHGTFRSGRRIIWDAGGSHSCENMLLAFALYEIEISVAASVPAY
jgi:hypothetical protein